MKRLNIGSHHFFPLFFCSLIFLLFFHWLNILEVTLLCVCVFFCKKSFSVHVFPFFRPPIFASVQFSHCNDNYQLRCKTQSWCRIFYEPKNANNLNNLGKLYGSTEEQRVVFCFEQLPVRFRIPYYNFPSHFEKMKNVL